MLHTPAEQRQSLLFTVAMTVLISTGVVLIAMIGLESYVRYVVNLNFAFVGGFELEALTIGMFTLIIAMMYLYRPLQVNK